jgi:hypothetical protein
MDVDKHKVWLVVGISIAAILVAVLLFYPKSTLVGEAYQTPEEYYSQNFYLNFGDEDFVDVKLGNDCYKILVDKDTTINSFDVEEIDCSGDEYEIIENNLDEIKIVPKPKEVINGVNILTIDNTWKIAVDQSNEKLVNVADFLKEDLLQENGLDLDIVNIASAPESKVMFIGTNDGEGYIKSHLLDKGLNLDQELTIEGEKQGFGEGYILDIDGFNNIISFYGDTEAGSFYAVQTFWWIFKNQQIPEGTIIDWPDYEHRLYYHNKPNQEDVTNILSRLKMNGQNERAFHLSDSQNHVNSKVDDYNYKLDRFVNPMLRITDDELTIPGTPYFCPKCLVGWSIIEEPFIVSDNGILVPEKTFSKTFNLGQDYLEKGEDAITILNPDHSYGNQEVSWSQEDCSFDSEESCLKMTIEDSNSQKSYLTYENSVVDEPDEDSIMPGFYAGSIKIDVDSKGTDCLFSFSFGVKPVAGADSESLFGVHQAGGTSDLNEGEQIITFPLFVADGRDKIDVTVRDRGPNCKGEAFFGPVTLTRLDGLLRNVKRIVRIKSDEGLLDENVDYVVETNKEINANAIKDILSIDTTETEITLLKELVSGSKVEVTYELLFVRTIEGKINYYFPNFADDYFWQEMKSRILQPTKDQFPDLKYVLLPIDEIRAYNRDVTGMTNSEFFEYGMEKWIELKEEYYPNAEMIIYGNAILPSMQGGNDNYYATQYDVSARGDSFFLLGDQKNEFMVSPWWYNVLDRAFVIRNSLSLFDGIGYDNFVLAPNFDEKVIQYFKYQLEKSGLDTKGWFGQCFNGRCSPSNDEVLLNIEDVETLAEFSWNKNQEIDSEELKSYYSPYPDERDSLEYCNYYDDDSDGDTDEVFATKIRFSGCREKLGCDLNTNPFHCGECGNVCVLGRCVDGQCIT